MNAIVEMYRSWYGNTQASLPWLEDLETEGLVFLAHCVAFLRPLHQVEPVFYVLIGKLGITAHFPGFL